MIRTFVSILITFAILLGLSIFELQYVNKTFDEFYEILYTLRQKTDAQTANYEDGKAVQEYWSNKKKVMHIWLPHTSLQEINLQLDEAVAFLYVENHKDALPKIEVVMGLAYNIPQSYELKLKNIL